MENSRGGKQDFTFCDSANGHLRNRSTRAGCEPPVSLWDSSIKSDKHPIASQVEPGRRKAEGMRGSLKAIEFRQTRRALLAESNGSLHLAECRCAGLANCFENRRVGESGFAFPQVSRASKADGTQNPRRSRRLPKSARSESANEWAGRKRQPFLRTASHLIRR